MSAAVVVRCPACEQLSRVPQSAVGMTVACPRCQHQFTASPHETPAPANRPRNPTLPVAPPPPPPPAFDPFADDEPPVVHPHTAGSGLIALALLPLGIPLLWLLLTLVRESVFTFAAPVAIAVSVCTLAVGLVAVRRWSAAVRTRAVLALVALAYLAAAVLYFAQPSWLEGVRALVNRTGFWKEYRPADRTFSVRVPGDPTPGDNPLPGWNLTAVRVVDPKRPVDVFVVAHGTPPKELPVKAADDEWFGRVKEAVLTAGTLVREQPLVLGELRVRDYEMKLPGDATAKRVVRVMRGGGRLYYLAVDGPSVTLDATDVQQFWDSFRLTKK